VLHPPLRTKIFVTSLAALTALGVAAAPSATASPTAAPTPATAPANPAADSARPSGLTVDGLARPADLEDLDSPRLSWIDPADTTQTAYQVVVSSTAARAAAHDGDVWDSGRVASARQTDVAYGGTALERTQRYYWSVRTWDARGKASGWSQPAWFGTGPGTDWAGTQSIWSPNPATQWTDYTLHAKVTVTAVALGLTFRAKDAADSYMWQLRGADNQLKTHVQVGGSYTVLKTVNLPAGTLAVGKQVDVAIAVEGSTITTIIDGKVVDTTTDRTWPTGVVGVRTGGSESGTVDDLRVVDDAHPGTSLLATSFDAGDATFPCGTVGGGVLTVGKSTSCLVGAASNNWAFLRDDVSLPSKDVAWATLFATATSPKPARQYVYKMYVNGRFVGLGPTQSVGAETRYDGFDVTSDLRAGANALGAIAYTTSGQRLEAQLVVRYADGTTDTFGTGNGWKALSGSAVYPNVGSVGTGYYTAPMEDIDNTKFPTGFDEPGYDDSAWAPVSTSASLPQLTATPTAKVQQQLERPVKIVDKGDGTTSSTSAGPGWAACTTRSRTARPATGSPCATARSRRRPTRCATSSTPATPTRTSTRCGTARSRSTPGASGSSATSRSSTRPSRSRRTTSRRWRCSTRSTSPRRRSPRPTTTSTRCGSCRRTPSKRRTSTSTSTPGPASAEPTRPTPTCSSSRRWTSTPTSRSASTR
jgi:alpha-L-rhamnosidase